MKRKPKQPPNFCRSLPRGVQTTKAKGVNRTTIISLKVSSSKSGGSLPFLARGQGTLEVSFGDHRTYYWLPLAPKAHGAVFLNVCLVGSQHGGQNLATRKTTGFSSCFHRPGFHFGNLLLTHRHVPNQAGFVLCIFPPGQLGGSLGTVFCGSSNATGQNLNRTPLFIEQPRRALASLPHVWHGKKPFLGLASGEKPRPFPEQTSPQFPSVGTCV